MEPISYTTVTIIWGKLKQFSFQMNRAILISTEAFMRSIIELQFMRQHGFTDARNFNIWAPTGLQMQEIVMYEAARA